MKRLSPFTQYRRYLLGEHYCYGYKTDNIFPMPIPTKIRERISKAWDEYCEMWSHIGSVTIEREQYEKDI
jgi:hypothetical protein